MRRQTSRDEIFAPLKVILSLFCTACAFYAIKVAQQLPSTAQQAILVNFQPVVPPIVMLWLWGARVKGFQAYGVEYELCFAPKDRKHLMPGEGIQRLALWLGSITAGLAALMCKLASMQAYAATEMLPIVLYMSLFAVAFLPWPMPYPGSRIFSLHTLQRIMTPLQTVSWADFLLADMLCSLSKSCADFSRAICWLSTGPVMQSLVVHSFRAPEVCSPTATPQLVALCLPYIIRFIQCFIVHRTTGKRAQLWNAAKYFSSLPALLLSAFEHEAHTANRPFPLRGTWLLACVFNSAFSYYWDVEHDWKMPWISRVWTEAQQKRRAVQGLGQGSVAASSMATKRAAALAPPPNAAHITNSSSSTSLLAPSAANTNKRSSPGCLPLLQQQMLHAPRSWYVWALCSNLLLRLLWMHRLVGRLEANEGLELLLALAEVWRRHQWVRIRIEAELNHVASIYSVGPTSPTARKAGIPMLWDRPHAAGNVGDGVKEGVIENWGLRAGTEGHGGGGDLKCPAAEEQLVHRHGFSQPEVPLGELQDGAQQLHHLPHRAVLHAHLQSQAHLGHQQQQDVHLHHHDHCHHKHHQHYQQQHQQQQHQQQLESCVQQQQQQQEQQDVLGGSAGGAPTLGSPCVFDAGDFSVGLALGTGKGTGGLQNRMHHHEPIAVPMIDVDKEIKPITVSP